MYLILYHDWCLHMLVRLFKALSVVTTTCTHVSCRTAWHLNRVYGNSNQRQQPAAKSELCNTFLYNWTTWIKCFSYLKMKLLIIPDILSENLTQIMASIPLLANYKFKTIRYLSLYQMVFLIFPNVSRKFEELVGSNCHRPIHLQ